MSIGITTLRGDSPEIIRRVLDAIPNAVSWKDRDLCYLGCNARFADVAGLATPGDIVGKTDHDMPWADQAARYRADDARVIDTSVPRIDDEEQQPQPDGTSRWLLISRLPILDAEGSVVGVIGTIKDITASKNQEHQQTLLERYSILMERMLDGIFIVEHGQLTLVNSALAQMTGYTVEEMIGLPSAQLIVPTDLAALSAHHQQRLQENNRPEDYETRLLHKDGKTQIDVIIGVRETTFADTAITLGTVKDITERKRSEAQLRSEVVFSETLIESLPGIFYTADQTGMLTRWNTSLQALLGHTAEQMAELSVLNVVRPDDQALVIAKMQEVFTKGSTSLEVYLITSRGEQVPYYLTGRQITIDGMDYFLGMGVDISERKHAEAERAQLQEEIIAVQEAALRELSTPLIPFSHEVVVMPLIGSVDSRRAQQVLETLLEGIASGGATIAILDITGVAVVDTQVANALVRAAQAVKLLGAQVVLTGIRPEVAQTLVGLGVDLGGIVTRGTLESGIAFALEHSAQTTNTPWMGR